jgi:hypothetical protein
MFKIYTLTNNNYIFDRLELFKNIYIFKEVGN